MNKELYKSRQEPGALPRAFFKEQRRPWWQLPNKHTARSKCIGLAVYTLTEHKEYFIVNPSVAVFGRW